MEWGIEPRNTLSADGIGRSSEHFCGRACQSLIADFSWAAEWAKLQIVALLNHDIKSPVQLAIHDKKIVHKQMEDVLKYFGIIS